MAQSGRGWPTEAAFKTTPDHAVDIQPSALNVVASVNVEVEPEGWRADLGNQPES
jgi:hypothetical protein